MLHSMSFLRSNKASSRLSAAQKTSLVQVKEHQNSTSGCKAAAIDLRHRSTDLTDSRREKANGAEREPLQAVCVARGAAQGERSLDEPMTQAGKL